MALNITTDGFVYMEDGGLSSLNVAYQAYFYKVNGGSSPSSWNNKRIVENTGYFNVNLGDGDWLTQDGSASSGDHIIIVFWSPASSDRLDACDQLTEWSCFRITLDGSSTYSNNIQVRSNICPNLNWTLSNTALIGQNVIANNTSTDTHQWDFSGNTMYHRNSWYTTLMSINIVDNSDYDWGDGNQDNDLSGTTNGSHSYIASGDYDIELVVEDACGCTVTGTEQIRVFKRPPAPNIDMIPADPEPNEPVFFQYVGDDVDDTIEQIIWDIVDDTNTITTVGRDDTVAHTEGTGTSWCGQGAVPGAFTDPGSHKVSIVISWFDGFETQTMNYNETYNQKIFSGPAVNFSQDPVEAEKDAPITFENFTIDTDRVGTGSDCFEYTWTWTDGTLIETETNKDINYDLVKTPTTASCKVKLCAQWSDGWETHNACVEKDVVFKTTVTVTEEECYYNLNIIGTSDDGSVSGYGWTVYSGASDQGPWVEQWTSPQDMEQNDKKICFTSLGWYKMEGTVYGTGTPTYDDEVMEIFEVCPPAPDADIVPICPPDVHGQEIKERKRMRARELKPGLRGRLSIQPSARIIGTPFPGPKNI